jgi:hypothetical protein
MTEPESPEEDDGATLFKAIGFALWTWQGVEKAHFKLYLRMLGAPQWEVCAAAYYSIESFAARHTMVWRMAHYFLQGDQYKSHLKQWEGVARGKGKAKGLYREIKYANDNRNKLAHYTLGYDVVAVRTNPDETVDVDLGPPTWRPVATDLAAPLTGRTPDRPEHNLTWRQVFIYAKEFSELGTRLDAFQESLNLPAPQLGLGQLLSPPLPTDPLYKPPQTPKPSGPEDNGSSGQ